ncbi:hypothetical protein DM02DRAFT_82963 [Periconia macrospinosa]|uniref:Uncharacterized protein n=1 Tax=Periconia macrospinosa TaxID=97972 RepID=A0A2V1CWL5_9PLEO|nr:hypothetical protein DM02DRAFT_82963 [Periconia macrospinosa]
MLASLWSFFASERELPPTPPSVKITGVRIPADDGFLFHVPDLRAYWNTELSWRRRDILRLDLLEHDGIPRSHHLRQRHDLKNVLFSQPKSHEQLFRLRQRYLLDQQYHVLPQQYVSCTGTYYVYYSYNQDALPKNQFVPAWICDNGDGLHYQHQHHGDVFLVKMAPHEYEYDKGGYGQNRWAAYEDVIPLFLDLLAEGPGHQERRVYHF